MLETPQKQLGSLKADYKRAGVDIAAGNEVVTRIKKLIGKTHHENVLSEIGGFAALYDLKKIIADYQQPILVQSVDGVGTKMMVAKMMNHFSTIGEDLVSAVVNDIVVLGAKPLTFLDYIANDHLCPDVVETIISGIANACAEHDIALVGGETAEMPGTYLPGEHDLVGMVTGVIEKEALILGKNVTVDDQVLGLASNGLHTNGYSLARHVLFKEAGFKVETYHSDLGMTIGESLLAPHLNYSFPVRYLLEQGVHIKGMAHITGGGLLENIPRILPSGLDVVLSKKNWPTSPLFSLLQSLSQLPDHELYRTFNMGIGLVMILSSSEAARAITLMNDKFPQSYPLYQIGYVTSGTQEVRIT